MVELKIFGMSWHLHLYGLKGLINQCDQVGLKPEEVLHQRA